MIQPAAPSVSSNRALTPGPASAQGDDTAVSGGFSAVLSSSRAAGEAAAGHPAAPQQQSELGQSRQDGTAAGKSLPPGLPGPDGGPAELAQTDGTAPQGEAPAADSASATPTAATAIIQPDLVLRLATKAVEAAPPAPTPAPQPADKPIVESLALVSAAQVTRPARIAIGEPTSAGKPAKVSSGKSGETESDDAPEDTAGDAIATLALTGLVAAAEPATPPSAPSATATSVAANTPASPRAPGQAPAKAAIIGNSNGIDAQPLPDAAAGDNAAASPAIAPTTVASATIGLTIAPQAGPIPVQAASLVVGGQPQATPVAPPAAVIQIAVSADQPAPARPQPDDVSRKAIDALSLTDGAKPAADAASGSAEPAALAPDAKPLSSAAAVTPQPLLTVPDMQAFSRTADPVASAPAAAAVSHSGHDFTTLVDRLVEAREAAVPQAVGATVSHGEFGQVSLRFEHDAGGLSVAMSSADPGFARAVQASAASAQSQTTSDNGSNAPRQDPSAQQQAAGSASGQPQPQSNSQASGDNHRSASAQTDNRSGSLPGEQGQDDESADARGGIYA